jgi:hypothetical protein
MNAILGAIIGVFSFFLGQQSNRDFQRVFLRDKPKHYGIRTIEEFSSGLARDQEIVKNINNSVASKLIWFVAIAGFSLLNINSLAERLAGVELGTLQLIIIVLPWVLTAIVGIVAYSLLLEMVSRDNIYYIHKQHEIRAFIANARSTPSLEEVLEVLDIDKTSADVALRKSEVDRISPWVNRFENLSLYLLILSFLISVLLPILVYFCP